MRSNQRMWGFSDLVCGGGSMNWRSLDGMAHFLLCRVPPVTPGGVGAGPHPEGRETREPQWRKGRLHRFRASRPRFSPSYPISTDREQDHTKPFRPDRQVISKACLRAASADLDGQESWSTWLNLGWESLTRFMGSISKHQGDISSRMSLRDGTLRPNAWINPPPSRRAQSI